MNPKKPFHRNYRVAKDGPDAGYNSWAYIIHKDYARHPAHYTRAFFIIASDLERVFEYIEPSEESLSTYSYRIHELLMRTCIEVEANFKAILNENTYTPKTTKSGQTIYNMDVYRKLNVTHHLSSYSALLVPWNGERRLIEPFKEWREGKSPHWYQAYNASKHDRHNEFKKANVESLIDAVAGLLAVISSQFRTEAFQSLERAMGGSGYDYHDLSPSISPLFRIGFPNDWKQEEKYDFEWQVLGASPNCFDKIDYNSL